MTEKLPSDLVQENKLTYGEFVRAKVAATGRKATVEDKIYLARLRQRRQERTSEIRRSFKVVSG